MMTEFLFLSAFNNKISNGICIYFKFISLFFYLRIITYYYFCEVFNYKIVDINCPKCILDNRFCGGVTKVCAVYRVCL